MKTWKLFLNIVLTSILIQSIVRCDDKNSEEDEITEDEVILDVDSSLFLTEDGNLTISTVDCTLSDGTETECYQIVSTHTASDHEIGPWCPEYITDSAENGGLWITDEGLVDLDGPFIENLATFYNDSAWMMYDEATGEVRRMTTAQECIEGAQLESPLEYHNMCAQCLPGWIEAEETYLIPITPVKQDFSTELPDDQNELVDPNVDYPPLARGLAFNGVRFNSPAGLDNILANYQVAPLDDAGGHINNAEGYHYHGDMGYSTRIEQSDGHASMTGYALDGHGIYAELDEDGSEATDLDECRGHYDEYRGYHYHVMGLEDNEFFECYYGAWAID